MRDRRRECGIAISSLAFAGMILDIEPSRAGGALTVSNEWNMDADNSTKRLTLQDEALALYLADLAGHDASGMQELAEINASDATYHGVPIKFLYLPKAFTETGYTLVRDAGETMVRILNKVIAEYLTHEDYRALFRFPKELEELILARPYYTQLLPVCRLDIFLNEETGTFKYCEFNADGSSAMNENRIMTELYGRTRIHDQLEERYEQTPFELFDSWVQAVLPLYAEHRAARLAAGQESPERPTVAISDFLEKGVSSAEFEEFRKAFERAGYRAVVAEIRDFTYENGRLYASTADGPVAVDVVYRRAVTSDILAHWDEVQPFLAAARAKDICLVGDFCTQVVHDKILFRILHLPRTREFLTYEDVQYVEAHVPYTAILTPQNAASRQFTAVPARWILKPEDSYGAHGIYYGGDYAPAEWAEILGRHAEDGYILQEYVTPYRTLNADYSDTAFEENPYQADVPAEMPPHVHSFANMTGMYLYCGRLAGVYSRLSPFNIISVEGDEHEMVSVVARPRS